jgi:DNA-binding GntR family transcriptional regulator
MIPPRSESYGNVDRSALPVRNAIFERSRHGGEHDSLMTASCCSGGPSVCNIRFDDRREAEDQVAEAISSAPAAPLPAHDAHRISSGEAAALYLRRLIFEGRIRPGERVPQDEIARALNISRIPIREALVALEQQGWVTVEKNRGAFVAVLDERAVRDHYDLFGLVYGFAARKALERSDARLGDRLAQLARAFAQSATPEVTNRGAIAFHAAVVDAAASPRINVILRSMSGLVPGNFYELVPKAAVLQRPGFTAIARAVRRNDDASAADEYSKMMRRVASEVVVLFRSRGLFV